MLTLTQVFHAFQIGIFAYIVSSELIKPKHILHHWFVWLEKLEKKKPYLAYPLGYCEKCFAGQIALWYFLIIEPFNFIKIILFISIAILMPIILKKLFYVAPQVDKEIVTFKNSENFLKTLVNVKKQDAMFFINEEYLISFKDKDNPFDESKPFRCKIVDIENNYIKFEYKNKYYKNLPKIKSNLHIETFKKIVIKKI